MPRCVQTTPQKRAVDLMDSEPNPPLLPTLSPPLRYHEATAKSYRRYSQPFSVDRAQASLVSYWFPLQEKYAYGRAWAWLFRMSTGIRRSISSLGKTTTPIRSGRRMWVGFVLTVFSQRTDELIYAGQQLHHHYYFVACLSAHRYLECRKTRSLRHPSHSTRWNVRSSVFYSFHQSGRQEWRTSCDRSRGGGLLYGGPDTAKVVFGR